ncbi:MAG: winged helix-turn-helix domain-containing protein [Nitrososphaerales archaeon]
MTGTTLRIYRLLYRQARPLGVNEIQRLAKLSSPSVAHYHLRKLVNFGLAHEDKAGYVVDRVVFENMIRIRNSLIPIQAALAAFFSVILGALVTVFRPQHISDIYLVALITTISSLSVFLLQSIQAMRNARFTE